MQSAKTLADIMTRDVATLLEEEDLSLIGEGMERFRFRHIPVVDGRKLVGVITQTDILRISTSSLASAWSKKFADVRTNHFVHEVMTKNVVTAGPDMSIPTAARLMHEKRVGCLPVVDSEDNLLGIVTTTDFLDVLASMPA